MSSPDKKITGTKHTLGNVDDAIQYTNGWIDNYLLSNMETASLYIRG